MEENKMVKIEDLKGKDLKDVVKIIEIKRNIPIRNQIATINALTGVILIRDDYGMLTYNSTIKDIMAKVAFASLATNIGLYDDDYDNYDVLQSVGLFEYLHNSLGNCMPNFERMLDDRINDIMRENSIEHVLAVRTDEMLTYVNRTLKHVETMLDKGDPNKIAKYLSKGVEAIANKLPDMSALEVADKFKTTFQPKENEDLKEDIEETKKEDEKVN